MDRLPARLLPTRVLSRLFRGLFVHYLGKAFTAGRLSFFSTLLPLHERSPFLQHLARVRTAERVVYAKPPFAGPHQVLSYVGRYTHRIAISNSRLLAIDDGKVRFRWKDYRRDNRHARMTMTPPVLAWHVRHNRALHENALTLTMTVLSVPRVDEDERLTVEREGRPLLAR